MLPNLLFAQITENSDFPARINSRDLGQLVQRETEDAYACPASARTGKDLALAPTEKASILRPIEALPLVSALRLVLPDLQHDQPAAQHSAG